MGVRLTKHIVLSLHELDKGVSNHWTWI